MPLVKNGRLIDDPWTPLDDADPVVDPAADIIVSLERWQREGEVLRRHAGRLGLRLRSDQPPAEIADDLHHFALVALEFPKFGDGRAYTAARLLRERFGFEGEIRAVGDVLRDQFFFMHRCGFDAFEVDDLAAGESWLEAVSEMKVWYQPATIGTSSPLQAREAPAVVANWAY